MINKDFFLALEELEKTNGITEETATEWIKNALVVAYKKNYGDGKDVFVKLDKEKRSIRLYAGKTVVADEDLTDPESQITLTEARESKKTAVNL